MKIKRYTAASMRQALALVREEQGPDAVIMSSRRVDEGIEVISAVDYDEGLINEASRQIAPAARERDEPWPELRLEVAETARIRPRGTDVPEQGSLGEVQRELKDLRHLLESELATLGWSERRRQEPLKAQVLEALSALDIAADVALRLASHLPRQSAADDPGKIPAALLAKHLPVATDHACNSGGVIALVGPTGVGKTTTIAKLAARWSLKHGSEDLALVSTDAYRIGAREQLLTFARILGAPMHMADSAEQLAQVMERLESKKLVLIDTAGMGQRDARVAQTLDALRSGAPEARVLLALPAQGESAALDEIVRSFSRVKPAACVLTKLDEAASLGGAISAVLRHGLPIVYLCDGQRVPEDIHPAHDKSLWLIRTALKLKEELQPQVDQNTLARHFGRIQTHA